MSLTAQQLLQKAQPRFEWVEVEGFGEVGIRSVSRLAASVRDSSYRDPVTGQLMPDRLAGADVHTLIDQLMISPTESMFTDEDFDQLASLDAAQLAPLYLAINEFNSRNGQPVPN